MGLSKACVGVHAVDSGLEIRKKRENDIVIALAGNPNVGKSTVFNAITGLRQHTGNWAGKTVASAQGYALYGEQGYVVVDIPGCYSLRAHSAEEEIARDFIYSGEADVVVVVCDAVCLERSIGLVLQVLEVTRYVVVCVNLMDEAAKKHIHLNLKELERRLDVPVIGTSARSGIGIENLYIAINKVQKERIEEKTENIQNDIIEKEKNVVEEENHKKYKTSEEICNGIIEYEDTQYLQADRKKDRFFTGRVTAIPIMLLLLLGAFWLTIAGANYPSEWLHKGFTFVEEKLMLALIWIGVPKLLREMLVYGVYRVVAWIVSVMLPPMAIFFPLFTILEDSGYLPRVAFNMDKCFHKCNTCGKQCLTMCMGLGCNAAGVTGCRIIDSPRERLIAVITNSFVPCNGKFPTLIAIIVMFFVPMSGGIVGTLGAALMLSVFILLGVGMTFLVSKLLSDTVLRGVPSACVLELPPYRRPQIGKVILRSMFDRTIFVLGRAVVAAAPAGLCIWLLANLKIQDVTLLSYFAGALEPLAVIMGLDGVILLAFILGMPANEIVVPIAIMAYLAQGSLTDMGDMGVLKQLLTDNGWTWKTAVCTMLFSLFHWPCATTCLTIRKETGSWKWTLVSILLPTVLGVGICIIFTFVVEHIIFL